MSITVVAERPQRTGELQLDSNNKDTRVFICKSTTADVLAKDFDNVVGLPRRGDANPRDNSQRMKSLNYSQLKAPLYFEVTCNYERMSSEQAAAQQQGGTDEEKTPVNLRPELVWVSSEYQRVAEGIAGKRFDVNQSAQVKFTNGSGVLTSAGEPFDPPITYEDAFPTLQIRRAERVFSARLIMQYAGTINEAVFVVDGERIETYTARMSSIRIGKTEYDDGNAPYRWVEYELQIKNQRDKKDKDWIIRPLDIGSYYIDSTGTRQPFRIEGTGEPRLGLLDGHGGKLADTVEEVVFLNYPVRQMADFNDLNLPKVSL